MLLLTAGLFQEPIVAFVILLAVILVVPLIFERLRLPGLVGLLAAGVALGPNGLNIFQTESETMNLLSDIGLIYLMFVAGLEIDIDQFTRTRNRSIGFGTFTFLVPLIVGTIVGRLFGFDWNPAILIGSLFASHTLLAYPIVSRLGIVNNEAVTVTIGATIFTDIGALLVLAICIGIHAGDFTVFKLFTLLGALGIYTIVILVGFDKAGREFFKRSGDEEGNQFLFVLLAVFLASVGAQLIGVEKIVGAFLSGLAVNRVVGDTPVKEKVVFVGSVLFIPIFFVDMGLLIRVPVFIQSLSDPKLLGLTIAIVVGLIFSKMAAAVLAKLAYRYSWTEMMVMGSLSLPQVAATLAATLVGYRAGLLTEGVLNSVIVLMLVTSTLGPILTARFATELQAETVEDLPPTLADPVWISQMTVLVPVYNPNTEANLLELAALIARSHSGRLIPFAVAFSQSHLNSSQMQERLDRSELLLERATQFAQSFDVEVSPILRIDDRIAQGITRASREHHANLIIMGWGRQSRFGERLFRTIVSDVLYAAPCPVAVARLLKSPSQFQKILIPIENLTLRSISALQFALNIATATNGQMTLMHVCGRATSASKIAWIRSQLDLLVEKLAPQVEQIATEIVIIPEDDIGRAIVAASKSFDLLILRSSQTPNTAGGLILGNLVSQISVQIQCSMILFDEPEVVDRPLLLPNS
ncbi:cation:proton antiporter domain-containing protein [Leptolyngbya sp. GGD]|uniref:cation:proton antiporter domain-containing protein n=1 Tax=Leptolyngbya sp. GGD TaxID=2997907 RepID=UPI00227C6261|nr:cation:proton antiporter [Leptolyngbya sp. GGD]MCY6490020.1 cation:proton antiporter [Leptolyngbya sp. GGD]